MATNGVPAAAVVLALFFAASIDAQDISGRIVFRGRVEDGSTGARIGGARLLAADSSVVVLADSLGEFAFPLAVGSPHVIYVDQIGYVSERFELEPDLAERFSVFRLQPQPFELEELSVVAEAALGRLVRNIDQRARAYPHQLTSLDKTRLERLEPATVYDVVRIRAPWMIECSRAATELCVRGRFVTFRNPRPMATVLVCVDEQRSYFPVPELSNMSVENVAIVEIYGREAIRVYTQRWLLRQAERGRTSVYPEWMEC
jgi:hypothetical protein